MTDSHTCDSQLETEAADEVEVIDLAHLRDLLNLLQESNVQSFQAGGMAVVFREEASIAPSAAPAMVPDDGHSTSNKPVAGFERKAAPDGFRHPSLWAHQGGKTLRFDGALE